MPSRAEPPPDRRREEGEDAGLSHRGGDTVLPRKSWGSPIKSKRGTTRAGRSFRPLLQKTSGKFGRRGRGANPGSEDDDDVVEEFLERREAGIVPRPSRIKKLDAGSV